MEKVKFISEDLVGNGISIETIKKANEMIVIPTFIDETWLKKALDNEIFYIWGFSYSDLSNCTFDKNIDASILRRIVISTKTKLPKVHPFNINSNDYVDKNIKMLNESGINGEGVNIAIIDQNFNEEHNEIMDSIREHINIDGNTLNSFHGLVVSSNLVGKNLGVAPKSNVIFYGCSASNEIGQSTIKALDDIYEKNLNGANIRLVSISGYLHTLSPKFETIKQKLASQNCYIIDSPTFGENYTVINERQINGASNYQYSWELNVCGWELDDSEKTKLAIPYPGISPLMYSKSDYQLGGECSYSWVIPRLTGIITLCMQLKPDITLDEFNRLAYETKYITEDGKSIINPLRIIEQLSKELEGNINLS